MDIFEKYGIPQPDFGESTEIFNDGSGLADDMLCDKSEPCTLAIIRNTAQEEFISYCEKIESAGCEAGFKNETQSVISREFYCKGVILYAYYTFTDRTARFVFDSASCRIGEFQSNSGDEKFGETCLMQYGLTYGKMIRGVTADCGMNYVIRLHDGRFIVTDGGESEQSTDEAIEDFSLRLEELTGGKKITIALWFCTHAHNDHIDFFLKYLRLHREDVTLERVMFNFPAAEYISLMASTTMMRERIKAYYPGVLFLKPHTGEKFNIGSCGVEILLTHEDMIPMSDEKMYRGMNETSTVAKFSFDGKSLLILADIPDPNGIKLTKVYEKEPLSCTYIQAAHHMINRVEEVYRNTSADTVLIPRWDKTLEGENYEVLCKYYDSEKFIAAGAGTVEIFIKDGKETGIKKYPPFIKEYDNSGI